MDAGSPEKADEPFKATKDKPRYLNLVHPDSLFTQRVPHNFDPKCLYRCRNRHPRDCEKYRKSANCLPMSPTLERLNIHTFDRQGKLDKIVTKHISEYMPQYMAEMRTIDKEKIKDIIFRKVITEVIAIDQRKSARRFDENFKPPNLDDELDASVSPMCKKVM